MYLSFDYRNCVCDIKKRYKLSTYIQAEIFVLLFNDKQLVDYITMDTNRTLS